MDWQNKLSVILAAGLVSFTSLACAGEANLKSPVGYWKTIDDLTGKPKSIIQISKNANQELVGKVIKIFPKKGEDQTKVCSACLGEKRNKPIVGMVVMTKLKPTDKQWQNGVILDPENGKTYSCNARLSDNGKKLNVHGYIGIPLFGRSQTWERVDLMSGEKQIS